MKELNFLYFLVVLFLLSCGVEGKRSGEMSVNDHISMESVKPLSEIVDSIRYICLKDKDEKAFFTGEITKIMTKGDTIYLLDMHRSKSLRAYKKDGEFLFNFGRLGKGPGEYLEVRNFTIDNQYIYCIDNYTRKLNIYSIDNGRFIKQSDLPVVAGDIASLDNGNFILFTPQPSKGSSFGRPQEDYNIFIIDQDLNIIDKLFPYNEDRSPLSTISAFTESRDQIFFSQHAKDTLVVFNKHSYLNPSCYVFDFGNDKASKADKENFKKLVEKKHIMLPVHIVDGMIIGATCMPDFGEYWKYGAFVYDISNKQTYQNDNVGDMFEGKTSIDKLVLPIRGVVGNEMISVIYSYEEYQKLVQRGFPVAPKYIETQLENGEPILVFYSLKVFK